MEKIKITLLVGIKHYGREKSFSEILDAADVPHTPELRLQAANALEDAGLIKTVSYQLPVSVRAELTPEGEEAAAALLSPRKLSKREMRAQGYN